MSVAGLALTVSGCGGAGDPAAARQERVADDPSAMMRIGEAAEAAGDWAAASTFYRRASQLDPGLASASLARARTSARLGDMDAALADLREAHRTHGDDVAITASLGRMLAVVKRPEEALAVFEEGLRVRSDFAPLLVGKGVVLDVLGRHAEAQAVYEAALKVDPDNAAARKNLTLSKNMEHGPKRPLQH